MHYYKSIEIHKRQCDIQERKSEADVSSGLFLVPVLAARNLPILLHTKISFLTRLAERQVDQKIS